MSTEYLADMMKRLQNTLKTNKNIKKSIEEEPPQKIKGGGPFNFMKQYLDMVFSKEKELKQEQKDSFQKLTEIKEQQKKEEEKKEDQQELMNEQNLLAQKEKEVENAKQNSLQLQQKAEQIHKEIEATVHDFKEAKDESNEARKKTEEAESHKEMIEDAIEIRKKNVINSENIVQKMYQQLGNKELVSLEETQDAIEENHAIQEIQEKSINLTALEKKTDDLLI
jgi:hypothetical protein